MSDKRTYPWEVPAAAALPGKVVLDGGPPNWQACTLVVETKLLGQVPTTPFDAAGVVVFQFEGQGPPAWYSRRFAVGAWGAVSLQVEQFRNYSLRILSNTLTGYNVVAMASEGEAASSLPPLLYPETLAAGAGVVPWGAFQMMPAQADAAFAWELGGITVPQALVAGVTYEVFGNRYVPSVFPFSAIWRIRP